MKNEASKLYGSPDAATTFGNGAGGDISKKIDLVAEKALIDCLKKHNVSCTLVSEEAGTLQIGEGVSQYYVTVLVLVFLASRILFLHDHELPQQ